MARQASSKSDSGYPDTVNVGFEEDSCTFGIRPSGFVITPARRLAIMNLAIRGIEADIGKEHADTFRNVQHPDICADYVLSKAKQSRTLATLRDTLLPKLLSGELSVTTE